MNDKALKDMRRARRRETFQRLFRNKTAVAGAIFIIALVLLTATANLYMDYDKQALGMSTDRLALPSAAHPFGTDSTGRDIFARVIFGARASLALGLSVTALTIVGGTILGSLAAFFGGVVDTVITRLSDMICTIPGILLALAILSVMGPSLINLVVALAITNIPFCGRIVRAVVLNTVGRDFVEAARAGGMKDIKIIFYHVLPNAIGPVIVQGTMMIAGMIIGAAGLSFIGMGVQPPTPEWGSMLSSAVSNMRNYPHLVIFPGMAIVLTALSFNLLGDGLRDALDPTMKD